MLTKLQDALSGYKTYVVALMVILIAVLEGLLGIDIPGADVGNDWIAYLLNGLGLGTLRAGIAKAAVGAVFGSDRR